MKPHRIWIDARDKRQKQWTVSLERGAYRPVLAFAHEGVTHTVVVDFDDGLEDLLDADLQRWLDEGRRNSMHPEGK